MFLHLGLYPLTKYEENPLRISRVKSLCGFWLIISLFDNTKLFEKKHNFHVTTGTFDQVKKF